MPPATANRPEQFTFADTPLRPGERMVAGRPYTFDLGLRNAYDADAAVESAPTDLSGLSDTALVTLDYQTANRSFRAPDEVALLRKRINAERTRRGLNRAFEGPSVAPEPPIGWAPGYSEFNARVGGF